MSHEQARQFVEDIENSAQSQQETIEQAVQQVTGAQEIETPPEQVDEEIEAAAQQAERATQGEAVETTLSAQPESTLRARESALIENINIDTRDTTSQQELSDVRAELQRRGLETAELPEGVEIEEPAAETDEGVDLEGQVEDVRIDNVGQRADQVELPDAETVGPNQAGTALQNAGFTEQETSAIIEQSRTHEGPGDPTIQTSDVQTLARQVDEASATLEQQADNLAQARIPKQRFVEQIQAVERGEEVGDEASQQQARQISDSLERLNIDADTFYDERVEPRVQREEQAQTRREDPDATELTQEESTIEPGAPQNVQTKKGVLFRHQEDQFTVRSEWQQFQENIQQLADGNVATQRTDLQVANIPDTGQVPTDLRMDQVGFNHIIERHTENGTSQEFPTNLFLNTANEPDIVLPYTAQDGTQRINIVRFIETPDRPNDYAVIGAKRVNGYSVVTFFPAQ